MAEGTVHEGKIRRVKRILYPLVKIIAYAGSSAEGYPTEIKIFFFLFLIDKSEFTEVYFMWFWWFMLICDMIIPVVMIIVGRMMWKHCPEHINGMLGYRTTRSMKNMDTWKFAHDYCGKLWLKIGWVMLIPSALIHIPLYHSDKNTIGFAGLILVTIQCFIMVGSIYPTEKALKKYFNDDGTRR